MDTFFADAEVRLDLLRSRAFNLRWAELPPDVIPLTAADPDFPAAPVIREAITEYAASGVFSYGPASGLPLFRESVSRYLDGRQCAVPPAGVIAVNSAAAGLAMVAQQWLAPGDEAIVFDPVDFLFAHVVRAAGAVPVPWHVAREGELDLAGLERLITPRTRMICVCNPHNPLGRCFTRAELEALGALCTARGLRILSDEIWSEIVYAPAQFTSMLALSPSVAENTVVVHGFSKAFALAGLRIGYVAMRSPADCAAMLAASQHPSTVDGVATLSQVAAAAAYDRALPWLAGFLQHLQARRDQVVAALRTVPGVEVTAPDATYVAFVRLPPQLGDVEACVQRLREEFRVAVVPGSPRWFGAGAAGHFRLCFATSEGLLAQGLERLVTGLRALSR
jgi:aspartate/methionine/tyrosine aminotransferase